MKWLYNMKISKKLIASFILVALIAGIMGIVGINNMKNIDADYTGLYKDYGISIGNLGTAGIDFNNMRVKARDVILEKDPKDKQAVVNEIHLLDKKIAESLSEFEKSIHGEQNRQLFISLKDTLEKYETDRDKAIDLALANQNDQAIAFLYGDGSEYAKKAEELLNQILETKKTNGDSLSNNLSAQTNSTVMIMIIIVVIGMIVAVVLGLFISRMISKPITHLVKSAEKIADGDLNVEIDIERKDEIGMLASAFERMTENLNEVMSNIQTAAEQVASGAKQVFLCLKVLRNKQALLKN